MVQTSIVAKTDTASATKPAPLPSPTQSLDFSRPHFLSGIEALALLPVLQRVRDEAAGLNTAGFISGYRGSPLGGLDQTLWEQKERLEAFHITFQPGINEDLAATAIWGTQQVGLFQGAKYDGVYSMWYGKGPGVDRSMDVFKHANAAGSSQFGGVLAVAGDDHGAKSSTLPHQSEHMFAAAMMPVLNPAGVQDYIDFGIHGWAMSRYSGCWIGLKATADTVESSASITIDPHRIKILLPGDELPLGGLNIRWPDAPMDQEYRLQRYKGYAAMSYARINGLNRTVMDSPRARLGIITTGKAYLDVRQALDDLGIDEALAREIGLRVLKVGMSWPLNSEDVHDFAQGLEEVLVVEEKRQLIEYQLKEQLYNWGENVRPKVIGKYDDKGEWTLPHVSWQLPAAGELSPSLIARVVAGRLGRFYTNERIAARVAMIEAKERALTEAHLAIPRTPHFCSGCPHNTSTLSLPEGSRALAGIGCHYMALWLDDGRTQTFSQMGGEGVAWVGQAPFTETEHVFANIGDGTYTHSGILAVRQAVSSGVSMTYKVLYNDAVAMTGGQPLEQGLTVPAITRQLAAEGVVKLVVVSDQPEKYDGLAAELAPGTTVHHRRELDSVQRTLRDIKGVTALVYDQTCAAEKRRRRRKGEYPDPLKRVFINDRVCEGCGDCSAKSNCMSVVGVETDYGPKRAIDQSSCNKDFSCSDGFCPSFVTIHGGKPRRGKAMAGGDQFGDLPEPKLPDLTKPYNILVTGVGGTGVVTIGAVMGRAAADEGRGVTVLDMAGLAQKGGPVWSHIRIAPKPEDLQATRIAMGEADVIIGCDEVVAIADDSLSRMQAGRTHAVINSDVSITSDIVRRFRAQGKTGDVVRFNDPDARARDMERQIVETVGVDGADFIAATRLATKLMGDSIATNAFMLGYVWQKGLLPVGHAALMTAIEIQGVAVSATKAAFLWGRRAAHDRAGVEAAALPPAAKAPIAETLEAFIVRRAEELTRYQDEAYARRYTKLVQEAAARETQVARGSTRLTTAVAKGYYKLLAYKDEYEVARLMIDPAFKAKLAEAFEGDYKVSYNLAPPLLSKPDPVTGKIQKREFGPWLEPAFRILARLKGLRGTSLDIFGYSKDRKLDRRLIADYEATVAHILGGLNPGNLDTAVALAEMPNDIRGYGHVKETYVANARKQAEQLKARFDQSAGAIVLAAE